VPVPSSTTSPGAPSQGLDRRLARDGAANVSRAAIPCPTATGTRTHVGETRSCGDVEDLARLVDELPLLVGVARIGERSAVGEDVERDRLREGVGLDGGLQGRAVETEPVLGVDEFRLCSISSVIPA
jgi:hypothetical protein